MRLLERVEDRLALDRVEPLLQRQPADVDGVVARRLRGELQVVGGDLVAGGERERALEDVLELAHVAREVVARELGLRARARAAAARAPRTGASVSPRRAAGCPRASRAGSASCSSITFSR